MLQEWDRAVDAFKTSIQYAPEYPLSYLHLANLYLRFNRREEAKALVLKALAVDKNNQFRKEAERLLSEAQKGR
jgi:tetratricopeptide (TPR) repeat protein